MICAGSSHPAPAAVNATPHRRALGYCPVCCRAHALTRAGRIWQHRTPHDTTPMETTT